MKDNRSFFEKLTGSINMDDKPEENTEDLVKKDKHDVWFDSDENDEGELTVDVYQTPNEIIIKSMVADSMRQETINVWEILSLRSTL